MFPIPNGNPPPRSRYLTYEQMNLINEFRQHSLEYAIWSRALATVLNFKEESIDAVYERLHREIVDMYGTFSNFYDQEISNQFLNIFTQQTINYRNLIEALLSDDRQAADRYWANWFQTADAISEFFAQLSPYWERDHWRKMLYDYQLMQYYEVMAIISGGYRREIAIFDQIVDQAAIMADYMSRGLMINLAGIPPQERPAAQPGTDQPTRPGENQPAGGRVPVKKPHEHCRKQKS